jgi:hypothetical protein
MTWALSLVPIMAMSVRILFTTSSHDRCWSVLVGSQTPVSPILALPSSDLRVSEHHRQLGQPIRLSTRCRTLGSTHPCPEVLSTDGASSCESALQGAY